MTFTPDTTSPPRNLLGDVDGDGKADLVIANYFPEQYNVALSKGSGYATPVRWGSSGCIPTNTCPYQFLADVNGDGKADLVSFRHGATHAGDGTDVLVSLSTGTGFRAAQLWHSAFCTQDQVCALGDVDGDNKADLIAFTSGTGIVWVARSTGTGFGAASVWHRYFCLGLERCYVGDVNGDRKTDLILFKPRATGTQAGDVLVALSNGTGFGAAALWHPYFCIDLEDCHVGDLNGDGKTDIALMKQTEPNYAKQVLVALSNGSGFVNATPFAWYSYFGTGAYAAGLADVNGDKRADMVVYRYPLNSVSREIVSVAKTTPIVVQPRPAPTPIPSLVDCGSEGKACCNSSSPCASSTLYCDDSFTCVRNTTPSDPCPGGQLEYIQACATCWYPSGEDWYAGYYINQLTCYKDLTMELFEASYPGCNVNEGACPPHPPMTTP